MVQIRNYECNICTKRIELNAFGTRDALSLTIKGEGFGITSSEKSEIHICDGCNDRLSYFYKGGV